MTVHLLSTLLFTLPAQAQEIVPIATDEERTAGVLHLWGQLQTWVTLLDQDVDPQADPSTYGDPEADPGFTIPRARIGIGGFVPMGSGGASQVDYALSVGIASPYDALSPADGDVQIVDAFGRWALPAGPGVTSLSAGLQRVPFSREAMISSATLVFQERAVATNWLVPSREAGATLGQSFVFGDSDLAPQVLARLGVFNGNGDVFGDTDPGLLHAARLEFMLGDAYRTWSADLDPAVGVGVSRLANDELATSTTAIQADLLARYSVVTLLGEIISSRISLTDTDIVDPGLAGPIDRIGWLAQLSMFAPLDGPQGLEVAARVATFDDDTDVDNNGDVAIVHAGVTCRDLLPQVDVGLGHIHRIETDEVSNDTFRLWVQVRPEGRFPGPNR